MLSSRPLISIILLTHNSARTIEDVFEGIIKQDYANYEILVIDSESTDETRHIAKNFPCKIISIKAADFGHGKTRNYAASLSKGEFIVFLTHDSVPEKSNWLEMLVEPFTDINVVGVHGQQKPRENENLLDKYFHISLYGNKRITWQTDNWSPGDNIFSDANSMIRKNTLLKYPYASDIIVSEDYEWAIRMLKQKKKIVYSNDASVIHSHGYTNHALFKRNFDVGVSYKTVYTTNDLHAFINKGIRLMINEIKYLKKSGNADKIPQAILRDFIRFIAVQLGKNESLIPKKIKRNYLSAQAWYWK